MFVRQVHIVDVDKRLRDILHANTHLDLNDSFPQKLSNDFLTNLFFLTQ